MESPQCDLRKVFRGGNTCLTICRCVWTLYKGGVTSSIIVSEKVFSVRYLHLMGLQIIEIQSFTCVVEEYAANGDLLQKIKKYGYISEKDSRFYFRQLIEALTVSPYTPNKLVQGQITIRAVNAFLGPL